jgi:DHA1 family tetracycline resistance protein-like MFS transporter
MKKQRLIIIITVFVDVLGIGIIIPILPFFVESFGVGAGVVTALFAVFSLFSFFSSPFLGALSDKIGRRPVLIISLLSTTIGWLIFAAANSVFFLFLGRIIDGLAAGNFPIAQNYLLDIAKTEKEKTANLGLIGAIFGIGFIIGPMFGGLLGSFSLRLPFYFVGFLALLNTIFAYFYLPETNHTRREGKISLNPLVPIVSVIKQKIFLSGLLAIFFFGLAIAIQQSVFSLYVYQVFGWGTFAVGLLMAGIGVLIAFNQGFLLRKLIRSFRQDYLAIISLILLGIGFIFLGIGYLPFFLIGVLGITFGQSIGRVILTSLLAKKADSSRQGELLGVLTSITSLSMIIGPLLAGFIFIKHPAGPFFLAALFSVLSLLFVLKFVQNKNLTTPMTTEIEKENQLLEVTV